MIKTTVAITGMMCGMCEAHVNDAIRREFSVKKVVASHEKGVAVILSNTAPDEERLRRVIDETGYQVTAIQQEPYEKKGWFSRR